VEPGGPNTPFSIVQDAVSQPPAEKLSPAWPAEPLGHNDVTLTSMTGGSIVRRGISFVADAMQPL
jgi:hypothetical protein